MVARGATLLGLLTMLALASGAAQAENLDAGKPAPALFAAACAACHSSPRGLAKDRSSGGLASFLEEHYTSSPQSASALAAYLIANPGSAKQAPAGRAATAPAAGASKQGEAKTERQTRTPQAATTGPDERFMVEPPVEPRRPADATKGRSKRQQTKQEAPAAPAASGGEPAATPPAAPAAPAPAAAPVAAAPPPDQPAFSAPSP